tara:strand:- start:187 stop:783 length:597 start_codon:yes stop_codon:yes gene_type:complete
MNIKFLIFALFFINGCMYKKNIFIEELEKNNQSYLNLKQTYSSCSGQGEIQIEGLSPWKFNFRYISQRDSSFIQFIDILGRKTMLMWLTADSLLAWNVLENKKYNHYQVIQAFPYFNNFSPNDITKILWGIKADTPNDLINTISYSFNSKSLNGNNSFVTSAILNNGEYDQYLIINIHNREHNSRLVDLDTHWRLIQS